MAPPPALVGDHGNHSNAEMRDGTDAEPSIALPKRSDKSAVQGQDGSKQDKDENPKLKPTYCSTPDSDKKTVCKNMLSCLECFENFLTWKRVHFS